MDAMTPAQIRRWDSRMNVTRALSLRIDPHGPSEFLIAAAGNAHELACMLGHAIDVPSEASYVLAERIACEIDRAIGGAPARLVVLASNAWGKRLASASSARGWPMPFEPMRGLLPHERVDFIRRASSAARAGKPVCGIKPWGAR